MQYKRFRMELIIGLVAVAIAGWLLHYVYEWSGNSFIVGLFAPVSESAWEHMKLAYLPMLILSVILMTRWGNELPPVTTGMLLGTFAATWLIPILFYTYRGIVGYGIPIVDMATFFVSIIVAGFAVMHLVKRCMDDALPILKIVLGVLVIAQGVMFLWFTYNTPGIGLFAAP
jgi:hypothetical protein